jgi:hypothetical protein
MVSKDHGAELGPFGNPDGSRAQLERVIGDFVDFGGDPSFGALATRANDSMVRVIVGKLGAGKTVYMRRLQDYQSRQGSVYADIPQQSPPSTEVIVKACQWFSGQVLVEKWMQIWSRAILREVRCRPNSARTCSRTTAGCSATTAVHARSTTRSGR